MANALRLYARYAGVSIRGQMQYRGSFIMLSVANFINSGIEFVLIWMLFDRFRTIVGWQLAEVALLYGMVNIAFAVAEAFARGFDVFDRMVRYGDFDRLLLRPRSTALQLAGQELQLMRVGRFLQGFLVLVWATGALEIVWTPPKVGLLIAAILGGASMFMGLFVLQATLAFWTIESLEVMNSFTYGGVETAQYPLTLYNRWFRRFFTFVIPLACVNYLPGIEILGKADPLHTPVMLRWVSPLIGVAFLFVALRAWKIGVRHYRSTGS